jgi:hypothetical protein
MGVAPPPTQAPSITSAGVNGNQLKVTWTAVPGADLYRIQVVQPPPAGPGGGALTVIAQQVSTTSVTVIVPQLQASVVVQACTGDGCGPFSEPASINATWLTVTSPALGTPLAGSVVDGPVVTFSWPRYAGATDPTYRLFVQDLSRQATALDVYTKDNFYAAYFKSEGSRYDALVIVDPDGPNPGQGSATGFQVRGASSVAPTMIQPAHQSSVKQGNVQLGWSPVPGATLYEYFVAVQGESQASVRGVTPGLVVQIPLSARNNANTVYSGIVRACPAGASCVPGSDGGWGPWSVSAGPGVTNFTVTP